MITDDFIKNGDMVTIVMGAVINGDESLASRSLTNYVFGVASEKQKNVYEMLVNTFYKCLNEVKSGVHIGYLDRLAKETIINAGYGDYGYWKFEESLFWFLTQKWNPLSIHSDFFLSDGMVFTIEPSIKIPLINAYVLKITPTGHEKDIDVIKVGNMVHVKKDGYELFCKAPPQSLSILNI